MSKCFDEVKAWTPQNKLKLKDQKNEAMLFGPTARGKQSEVTSFSAGFSYIALTDAVRGHIEVIQE